MTVKTIILKGAGISKEGIAASAITPGMLVDSNSTGGIIPNASAVAAFAQKAFAREREYTGDGIDVAYAANDTIPYTVLPPGAEIFGLIEHTANITIGDALESAGDGTFQKRTTGLAICQALETLNNTSGSAARLKMVVL